VVGHNAQVTRLLGGFGRMRGGMRLEFNSTLHNSAPGRGLHRSAAAFQSTSQRLCACVCAHRVRLNGGTLIYLEDLGRAQSEAQQMKKRRSAAYRVDCARGAQPLSAINQAPSSIEGRRRSARRRTIARYDPQQRKAHRSHRRRSAATQPPRPAATRDRDVGRIHALLIDEIVQAENVPPKTIVMLIPEEIRVMFDAGT
jgi:hypothetical protein